MLEEIVQEERTLQVDTAECVIDRIMADQNHPRNFDAARFVAERRGRDRGYGATLDVTGQMQHRIEPTTQWVPIEQRDFHPEAWDVEEATRFAELMAVPLHALTREQYEEIQELKKKAKVLVLSSKPIGSSELKPLPPPTNAPMWIEGTIDRGEGDSNEDGED